MQSSPTICTVITKSYLAHARTLANSFRMHHPDGQCIVLLVDELDGKFDPSEESFKLVELNSLPQQALIRQMAFYYTAFEFCNALKPFLHAYILQNTDVERWLYLDADMLVCGRLDGVLNSLDGATILLSEHIWDAVGSDLASPVETTLVSYGIYNGGLLGLRRCDLTSRFVTWFCDRLSRFAFADGRLFVDQKWLDLVPCLFGPVANSRHPGVNLGFWNLHARKLSAVGDTQVMVDGVPLVCVHFAGWDIERPDQVSRYTSIYDGKVPSIWSRLGKFYRDLLLVHGFSECKTWAYSYDFLENGVYLSKDLRRQFYDIVVHRDSHAAPPFSYAAARRMLRLSASKSPSVVATRKLLKNLVRGFPRANA